jgi:acyl carrier protein
MDYEEYCKMIEELMPEPAEIRREQQLSGDLGLCSFDMMLLTQRLEAESEEDLDVTRITKYTTVGELYDLIGSSGGAELPGQSASTGQTGQAGKAGGCDG